MARMVATLATAVKRVYLLPSHFKGIEKRLPRWQLCPACCDEKGYEMSGHSSARQPTHYMREWRRARGVSLRRMAELIPYNKASLSRVENGLQPYHEEMLLGYARVCGCQPGDLLSRRPGSAEELWTILGDCSEDQLSRILSVTRILVEQNP
jgi:transcriptional regulator with XRE-family HTH domain